MPFFTTPHNYPLHYQLHGPSDAPQKVLLIMGFACCRAYWDELVERLLEHGKTPSSSSSSSDLYQICVYDSRGFGQSGDSLSRYSSSSMGEDAKALLMHLNWIRPEREMLAYDLAKHSARKEEFERRAKQPFHPPSLHLVGWSMGGMVAQELTLNLVHWADSYWRANPSDLPVMNLKSSVIAASSRGGFTHRGERYDAEPIEPEGGEAPSSMTPSYAAIPFHLLQRCLRRSRKTITGRYGWGRTFKLRNVPPLSGLVRMFRCVFLSLYHSRIERVLELHYSSAYLDQPYVPPNKSAVPSSSALSHLPLASAAMTSSNKSTIEVHPDSETGGFSYQQRPEVVSPPVEDESDSSDEDDQTSSETRKSHKSPTEFEDRPTPAELLPPVTVQLTPAQQNRLLQREEDEATTESSPSASNLDLSTSPPSPLQRPAFPRRMSTGSANNPNGRVLTNREVLSSQYVLRAPFDRYIFLYLYALFGHGLTCLTHHVSRARIREFLRVQKDWRQRHDPQMKPVRMVCITGASDILVHPSNSFHLSEQFNCPLYVLEGVGHMLHGQ